MDTKEARELLRAERERVERLIAEQTGAADDDREAAQDEVEGGEIADPAEPLVSGMVDDAIGEGLRERLAAIKRAEERLAEGTYGRSVLSGASIPDERLRADPAAELTVEEAERAQADR
jgi:RNA polymerase-binding transcription factor